MELCDSAKIVEKLNEEFDDLQNLNQKLIEEIEVKAETIKEQELELKISSMFIAFKICRTLSEKVEWFYDFGENLHKKGIIEIHNDYDKKFLEWKLAADADPDMIIGIVPGEFLEYEMYEYEEKFTEYVYEEVSSAYF